MTLCVDPSRGKLRSGWRWLGAQEAASGRPSEARGTGRWAGRTAKSSCHVRFAKWEADVTVPRAFALAVSAMAVLTLGGCGQKAAEPPPPPKKAEAEEATKKVAEAPPPAPTAAPAGDMQPNPERNAYFGETHIHTSWSVDAWVIGNRLTGPDDAYKYAQGQTIKHPLGYDIKIDTPMDFMGVTDHSEYVGITKEANTPGSAVSKLPEAQPLVMKDPNNPEEQQKVFLYLLSLTSRPPVKAFMSPQVAGSIWKENVKIADENNRPGKFTAFCSYEYTSQFNNRNLHRNIFFRECAKVPELPYSMLDSWHPEDLWNWMDTQRKAGNELLAISHNANLSDGWMYPTDASSTVIVPTGLLTWIPIEPSPWVSIDLKRMLCTVPSYWLKPRAPRP